MLGNNRQKRLRTQALRRQMIMKRNIAKLKAQQMKFILYDAYTMHMKFFFTKFGLDLKFL